MPPNPPDPSSSPSQSSTRSRSYRLKKYSERFRDFNADTTLRSSDDVLFKVYKKQLETHSGAFAGAEEFICIPGEELQVTESSEVLEILLQFMSLQCPPDLTKLEFSVLAPLAEAVEKYQVFSAMLACNISMTAAITAHPVEVLEHAVKHRHIEMMDEASRATIGMSMNEVRKHLSVNVFLIWTEYFQLWLDAVTRALRYERLDCNALSYYEPGVKALVTWSRVESAKVPKFSTLI